MMNSKNLHEPLGIGGYTVTKNSWRGKYKRLMSITSNNITTYHPQTLEITNSWEYKEVANFVNNFKSNKQEFIILVPKGRGKALSYMYFSTPYIKEIMSDIYSQFRKFAFCNDSMIKSFSGSKISHNGKYLDAIIQCTPGSLDILSQSSKRLIKKYYYKEISSIHQILDKNNGIVLKNINHGRMHGLLVKDKEEFIQSVIDFSFKYLEIRINIGEPISMLEFQTKRLGEFENEALLTTLSFFNVEKIIRGHDNPVSRILTISECAIIDRDPKTYTVVSIRYLAGIHSFYRSIENPQLLGVEWFNSFPKTTFYQSSNRDSLIATLLESCRISGNHEAFVQSSRFHRHLHFNLLTDSVDEEIELSCIRSLNPLKNNKFNNIIIFNSNIQYFGFKHAHNPDYIFGEKKEKIIQDAIISIINIQEFSTLSIIHTENIFFALKRLFSSKAGFNSFISLKIYLKLGPMIISAFKKKIHALAYSALEALNSLIIPFHPNPDLYYEQQNRISIFSDSEFLKHILNIFKENIINKTGSLVISSVLDFISFAICDPYSTTTIDDQFKTIVKLVTDVGYPLFRLFNHPSTSIVKSIGNIVKTLLDESETSKTEKIQEMALQEGIFPKHLYSSLFMVETNSNTLNKCHLINRQLSRKLLSYWVSNSTIVKTLLYRSIPHGLVHYLYSRKEASSNALEIDLQRTEVNVEIKKPNEFDVMIQSIIEDTSVLFKHWHAKMYESISGIEMKQEVPSKTVELRPNRSKKIVSENWNLFYERFYQDFYIADLIWNHKTREELRDVLDIEIRALNIDEEICTNSRISWNYEDFEVIYHSLKDEIRIGKYYLNPLIEKEEFSLFHPKQFFNDLYNVFLKSKTKEMKISCLKAMTKIYQKYFEKIKLFKDTSYIYYLLSHTESKLERDLYIICINKLSINKENCRILISLNAFGYLLDLSALSHLHTTRATVPLQTLMLEGSSISDISNSDWYINTGVEGQDPVTTQKLKEMYELKEVNENTKIWTQGMEGWKCMNEISQIKWTILKTDSYILNETDLAINILEILLNIVRYFPNLNSSEAFVRPLPRITRYLSEVNCLPHLIQLLLTFQPQIIERVAVILNDIMIENPVLPKLFISGCYFFMLMYPGSNISSISKFLKSTHLKQSFISDDISGKKKINKSILCPLLPEAMVSYLEKNEYTEFAKAFLSEYNNPELIWSNNMRRHMIQKISVHLSDFITQIKNNVKSIYIYCPIPKIEYEELENELFCGRYYLKHLCDTQKYQNWNIIEPLETLRDIIDAWKEEGKKITASINEAEAYNILGLEHNNNLKQQDVRRAYLKLVSRYHPDKNSEGHEIFDKIVNAYEYICNNIIKKRIPTEYNINLFIKSQSILFINCKKQLEPYKYSGYPLLISTILKELSDPSLFSKNESENLLLSAMQLAHNTISCSALNAEELRRENGINVFSNVFDRCINFINTKSEPNDSNILIIEQVIRCFIASSRFSGFIDMIIEIPQIFQNLNHILCHEKNLLFLCSTVVEFLTCMCASELVQIKILKYGIVYHMIYFLFLYDYTLFESESKIKDNSNIQLRKNELANLCIQCLSIISVNKISYDQFSVETVFKKLLTTYIVEKMTEISSYDILKILNTNSETPYIVWNNSTRSQLIKLLSTIRKYNSDFETNNYEKAINHFYDEDKDQLIVGRVYIYIFNKNPSYKIESPKNLAIQLLTYIENEIQYIYTALSSSTDEDSFKKRLKNLYDINLALYNVYLQEYIGSIFQKVHIINLFSIFNIPACINIQIVLIKIINLMVSESICVNTIGESNIIGYLNLALNNISAERKKCISIYQSLFYNNKIVSESLTKGTYIYLLDIFCRDKDIETRTGIIELFARLMTNKLYGPKFNIIIQKFLPKLFIDAILDNPQSAILLYESIQENPEIVWNEDTRNMVTLNISKIKEILLREQQNIPNYVFELSDEYACSFSLGEGLVLANVNVQRYIAQPSWVLRHPKEFLCELFESFYRNIQMKSLIEPIEEIEMITTAICLLLEWNSNLLDQLQNLGHHNRMIYLLEVSESQTVIKSAIKILNYSCKSKICVSELCKNEKWLPIVIKSFKKRPDQSLLSAEIINKSFSHEDSIICLYVLKYNLIPDIVDLLKLHFSEVEQPAAVRAHIVNGIQSLEKNPDHGEKITAQLCEIPEWRTYKFQKHDLFIKNVDSAMAITHNPAGISGYLMAAHNTSSQSYSSSNVAKMINNTKPPLPPEIDK